MGGEWYPKAVVELGANAGYKQGRSWMHAVVCHYTVGRNSTPIGLRGFFNFLVTRDGTVVQFAEVDAVTWHAGEWNAEGPGIEVEYLDEETIFTPEALAATGELVRWLGSEWGVPLVYHDGERVAPGGWRGFISHRSLIQREQHHDYWPVEDWTTMTTIEGDDVTLALFRAPNGQLWICNGPTRRYISTLEEQGYWNNRGLVEATVSQEVLDSIPIVTPYNRSALAGAVERAIMASRGTLSTRAANAQVASAIILAT
jgi:hypothetical protein